MTDCVNAVRRTQCKGRFCAEDARRKRQEKSIALRKQKKSVYLNKRRTATLQYTGVEKLPSTTDSVSDGSTVSFSCDLSQLPFYKSRTYP